MFDANKIIPLLIVFLVLVTLPFWSSLTSSDSGKKPNLVLPTNEKQCVESKEYMQAWHMDLLNDWRDMVVRDGIRDYTAKDGKVYKASLSSTCLKCHDKKEQFCDECHNYVGVKPYCWDCHVYKKGN